MKIMITLQNIAPEDIEDLLVKIEYSFGIKFANNELNHIISFGQFCDCIKNKIRLEKSDSCTTQQAFYKLRNAIKTTLDINEAEINPSTKLADLLPREIRIIKIREIEQNIGFNISILKPPNFTVNFLATSLLVSFIGLFFIWQYGLLGIVLSWGGFWFADKIGKEFSCKTVGQVAIKMTQENYIKSRRNTQTFNNKEITKTITGLFSEYLALDRSLLTRDTQFASKLN